MMAKAKRKSGINIKKSNQGKLRKATGTKKGKKIPLSTLKQKAKSKNPKTRKRAQFALNARNWNKKGKS
jgi:oligoendopeptidase F